MTDHHITFKNRVAAGLCGNCGKVPPRDGRKLCTDCAIKERERAREYRAQLRQAHRCSKCGQQLPKDRYYCICEACDVKNKALYRVRVARRKAAGECVTCGRPLDREGRYCTACCEKQTRYYKQWSGRA